MSPRIVTPAEAQEIAAKPALYACRDCGEAWDFNARCCAECDSATVLFVRHPVVGDLAATVAAEPARIAAAVAEERAAIVAQIRAEAADLRPRNVVLAAYADALNAMADTLAAGRTP